VFYTFGGVAMALMLSAPVLLCLGRSIGVIGIATISGEIQHSTHAEF